MAGQYTTVAGALGLVFGLVPMLWTDNGWGGALRRVAVALPVALFGVLGLNAFRAWKGRRDRRRATGTL